MDNIELKSNRKFILYMYLPLVIINNIFIIIMIIGLFIDYKKMSENLMVFYLFVFLDVCYIIAILMIKLYKGKSYIFDKSTIYVFNKGILKEKINISNVKTMNYYPFKFHYFITIFGGALNEGGAMKIHISDFNGTKHALGFIGYKDAKILQQKLYPNLLKIFYDKEKCWIARWLPSYRVID